MEKRAERIHKLIIESGKSYQELEKLTGIRKSSLHRYASGFTEKIPLTAIEKLASAFNVSEAFIMWGENVKAEEHREVQKKNDILSDIILKLREDSELLGIVEAVAKLDTTKRIAVMSVINAFSTTDK